MGKIYRFLSVLSLAICLLVPVVVPSISFAEEDCNRDCEDMSDAKRREIAHDLVMWKNGGKARRPEHFFEEYVGRTYCPNCYIEASLVLKFAEDFAKGEGTSEGGGCMKECRDKQKAEGFEDNGHCRILCRNAVNEIEETRENINNCREQAGWENSGSGWDILHEIFTAGYDHWIPRTKDIGGLGATYTKTLNTFLGAGGGSGCWFCPIFDIVFNSVNKLGTLLYIQLRGLCLSLLAIFGMAWIFWTVFKLITTIHGPNIGEFATKVFKNLLLWSILAIILWASPSVITRYVIDPFAALGTGLSTEILTAEGMEGDTMEYTEYAKSQFQCGMTTIISHSNPQKKQRKVCERKTETDFRFTGNNGESIQMALSADVYNDMNCMLRRMSLELIGGIALGASLISEGMTGGGNWVIELPQWSVLAVGILIFISFFALFISVPLKLIDLLLRLGFVIVLLPIFIACMATPVTREYSKKGWDMFISCWISLISLFLFMSLALMLVNSALLMD